MTVTSDRAEFIQTLNTKCRVNRHVVASPGFKIVSVELETSCTSRLVNGVSVQRCLGVFVLGSQCQRPTRGHLLLDPEGLQSLVDMSRMLVEQPRPWLRCLLALLQPWVGLSGWLTV